jgi:hypothetical protein
MLTQKELKRLVNYNEETGIFSWKINRPCQINKDDLIGSKDKNGYLTVHIGKRHYKLHRLVFLYVKGRFPKKNIDHINGTKTDNRFNNLREVSHSLNCRNRPVRSDNKSGHQGVSYTKLNKKWRADIGINGKRKYLGEFKTYEEALEHRIEYEKKINFFEGD